MCACVCVCNPFISKQTNKQIYKVETMDAYCVRALAPMLMLSAYTSFHNRIDFYFVFLSFIPGIVLIVNASEDFEHTEELRMNNERATELVDTDEAIDIGLIIGGIFLTLFGFVLIALYIKVAEWRRHCICPCGLSKKQGNLARQLQSGTGGTQLPLNPSTDPLVSHTQYAPVSELPRPDDEERRTLMTDNKDWYVQTKICLPNYLRSKSDYYFLFYFGSFQFEQC